MCFKWWKWEGKGKEGKGGEGKEGKGNANGKEKCLNVRDWNSKGKVANMSRMAYKCEEKLRGSWGLEENLDKAEPMQTPFLFA